VPRRFSKSLLFIVIPASFAKLTQSCTGPQFVSEAKRRQGSGSYQGKKLKWECYGVTILGKTPL
jgi:hypothetical protein